MKWDGIREHCDKWRKITYGALLSELAAKYGSRTAVVCDEIKITYAQLDQMSDSVLALLLAKGLKKEISSSCKCQIQLSWSSRFSRCSREESFL